MVLCTKSAAFQSYLNFTTELLQACQNIFSARFGSLREICHTSNHSNETSKKGDCPNIKHLKHCVVVIAVRIFSKHNPFLHGYGCPDI